MWNNEGEISFMECKGLNDENKRGLVRNLVSQWRADIYVLVETKLMGNVSNLLHTIWNNRWVGELHLEAVGSSRGILILWDKRVWEGELVESGEQCISCKLTSQNQNLTWYLTAVYAKCKRMERRDLWCELGAMRSLCEGPWVVCGDFNVIRYPSERTNCSSINGAMSEFSDCIEKVELIDPPLFGGSFTWRRGENHTTASRIDRIMYSAQWEELFTLIRQSTLPKLVSDHNPVLLTCGDMNFKKSYFKFETGGWGLKVSRRK